MRISAELKVYKWLNKKYSYDKKNPGTWNYLRTFSSLQIECVVKVGQNFISRC
jgi:hypothetical protein